MPESIFDLNVRIESIPLLLAHDDAHAPAGHRVTFRQRVHLQCDVACALGLHDRDRGGGIADETVRVVVHDQDVVPGAEIHDFLNSSIVGGLPVGMLG